PRHPARGRRDPARGGAPRRPLPRPLAVLRGVAGDPLGRSPGRRAYVRLSDRDPRGHVRRRHDRRLGTAPVRPAGDDLEPDHQRDPGREPGGPRPDVEASRHDRVGVASREVSGPDGRAWRVRVYRFRAPRWRDFGAAYSEDPSLAIFWPVDIVLGVLSAVFMGLIVPFLVIVVETPVAAVRA